MGPSALVALARWLSTSPLGSARVAPVEVQPTTIEVFAREQLSIPYPHRHLIIQQQKEL